MTIIDGLGDELTQFLFIVFCGIVALLAWWSTGQRQNRYRTAVIVERNVRNIYGVVPQNSNSLQQPRTMLIIHRYTPDNASPSENDASDLPLLQHNVDPVISEASTSVNENSTDNNLAENNVSGDGDNEKNENETNQQKEEINQDVEMSAIVNTMDCSETNVLRNRRLAFFSNRFEKNKDDNKVQELQSDESHSSVENNVTAENSTTSTSDETDNNCLKEPSEVKADKDVRKSQEDENNIRVRLKYLNDDVRLVEGRLSELLGEFKKRHFEEELSNRKLVRLIFNGQVLSETATLKSCGLFDDCVVHCLVHQPRTLQQLAQVQQQLNPTIVTSNLNNDINIDNQNSIHATSLDGISPEERDWDLGHILFTLLASLLSIAWYMHIRFSSLFGLAASLAMMGLTSMYIIAVICVYFPASQPMRRARMINRNNRETTEATVAE